MVITCSVTISSSICTHRFTVKYLLQGQGKLELHKIFHGVLSILRKLLVTTRKKLKTTGIDRTPGGTPITTTSHDAQI